MRKIKFRAWYEGKMIPVGVMHNLLQPVRIGRVHFGDVQTATVYELLPEETPVMQSTGYINGAGQEVFEGDIVEFGTSEGDYIAEIVWDNDYHALKARTDVNHAINPYLYTFTVIGNIYENHNC